MLDAWRAIAAAVPFRSSLCAMPMGRLVQGMAQDAP